MGSLKCENCGSNLEMDKAKRIQFCPYCGAKIVIPETSFDHEKTMAVFNEAVRQTIVKEEIEKEKRENRKSARSTLFGVFLLVGLPLLVLGIVFGVYKYEEWKLENLSNNVQQYILEGRLDEAQMEASKIRLSMDWSSDSKKKWDQIRENYIKIINEKKKTAEKTCPHEWVLTGNERDNGFLFWWTHQQEYKCTKCGNIKWEDMK